MEDSFLDKFGNSIKLTDKRWEHITKQHPEAKPFKSKISEVLKKPDLVKKSARDKG